MEEWETLLENYEINNDSKTFNTIIRSAKYALDEDLAPFESDWIFSTLIKKPINLLEVVAEHRMSDEYNKSIVEALKLLGDAVDKYDNFEKYYEEVSQLCLLQYPAVPRQQALCCLTRIARRSPCAARGLRGHLTALQQGVCMAPLAVLIGSICEHQPHVAADDVVNIWRVFLNVLDSNKYSGAVMKAVLQGILGLFKHFGDDLPTMELIKFYERLVVLLDVNSCQEVCFKILTHHARLFFTCVTRDASTRALLWRLSAFEALEAVYAVCDAAVLQEVKTYVSSPHPRARGVARRLVGGAGGAGEDVHELEAALRNGGGDAELGDKISWSIQSNTQSNHRLLQAAVLFYDTFPAAARAGVLLAVLRAPAAALRAAITFLIAEISRNQKLTIWHDILKCETENMKIVYDNINKYINTIVEGVAEGSEGPPLPSLLPLLLSLPPRVRVRCRARVLRRACLVAGASDTTALLAAFCGTRNISIDDCNEDEVKIKCSLVVLYGMEEVSYPVLVSLAALQTIFSTTSMEATVLSAAVRALGTLARDQLLDHGLLTEIIHNLEKIRKHTDKTKKADRVLSRDIFMFVGKHRRTEYNDADLNSLIVDLKNSLTILIPHDAGTLKMNLDAVLYSALQMEDEDALSVLMSVICANLSRGDAPPLQRACVRACVCASHSRALHAHALGAARLCAADCARGLLQYIVKEKSSESRKILLEILEMLIKKDSDDHRLENIVENIIYTEDQNYLPSYIHVLDTMNNLLKENNSVCLKLLPDFVLKVLKTPKSETILVNTYNLFTDKMYIYDDLVLNDVIQQIITTLNNDRNVTKNNITLDFIKNILIKTNRNINEFMSSVDDLRLFVSLKRCFDFDVTLNMSVLERVRETLFEISYDLESVLEFVDVFSDVLLENEYEKTTSLLSQIIEKSTSRELWDHSECLIKCLNSLKIHLQVLPEKITFSIEKYIKKININELTQSVEKNGFNSDNERTIHAVKVMIEALEEATLNGFDSFIVSWKDMFHKLYHSGYFKMCLESKIEVLSDLTFVALKFMNEDEIKCVILQGPDDFGLSFTGSLMSVFFPHLSGSLLTHCSALLHHVLSHARGRRGDVTALIDQIWPYYEKETTFRQKQLFLLDYLPHSPANSEPLKWVMSTLNSSIDVENKLMILDVLPPGDIYGPLPLLLLPLLPSRLSELEGSSSDCFRAILDALAINTHTSVLEAIATLADNDPTAGWWDSALSGCMSSVSRGGEEAVRLVWAACLRGGRGSFERLMMPLLRHSKSSVIESFVSSILEELLSTLRRTPRGGSCPRGVERHLMEHARAFNILEIVFQRVPREHIESPRSQLYRHMSVEVPYHLVSVVCKLCVTLRAQAAPPGGGGSHRLSLGANYRCLSAALLCRRPRPHVYSSVMDPGVWRPLLTDQDEPWTLTTRGRQSVPRPAARSSSVRSRVFLRTLSENPLAYDLLEEEEEIIIEDFKLPDSPLNRHSCMPAVTALLNEVGGGGGEVVRKGVLQALEGETPLARFIAQAVSNAREALRGHAGGLAPALCALVGGRVNDLHLHVLDTVIYWRAELVENESLNKAIESLIVTAVEHGRTDSLYRVLLDKLTKILDIYGKIVRVSWTCFEKYFTDPKSQSFAMCLRILNRINVYIPELLPAVSLLLERRVTGPGTGLWSVYGKALRATHERGGGEGELKRCRSVLEAVRRGDPAQYMRALYCVQREHPPACDAQHYRLIADLVPKIPHRERPKCLSILSTYIERCGEAHSLLETLDLLEEMDTVQGLELAKVSLHLMTPPLRARVCAAAGALRGRGGLAGAAYQLLLRDFELNTHTEPSIKRRTLTPHPHIYTAVGVARGLEGAREDVRGLSTDLGVRLCECFILCVVVPLQHNLNVNMSAILDLFFQEIRKQDIFKNAKLSEDDFEFRAPSNPMTSSLPGIQQSEDTAPGVNTRMSIEDVLNSLIKFSRKDERVCTAAVVQLLTALGAPRPGFDLHHALGRLLRHCLTASAGAGLLQIARNILTDTRAHTHILEPVTQLMHRARNSEGEGATRALYEELLAGSGGELVLGRPAVEEEDVPEVSQKFSMKDLISTFGELSNWDSISRHERARRAPPPLWTDRQTFARAVDEYDFKESPLWLRAMVSKYKGEDINTYKVLKDLDKWPRKHFDIAAVLEALVGDDSTKTRPLIHPSECLAQWAARIMAGSLYTGDSHLPSRSLSWCERGNELALHQQVVACCGSVVKTEKSGLVNFIYQEMLALRGMALERKDRDSLRNLLVRAESYNPLEATSSVGDMLGMNELTLLLRQDLNCLEPGDVAAALRGLARGAPRAGRGESASTLCVLGMTLYQKLLATTTDVQEQNSLLRSMCELLGLHASLALPWSPLMSDVVLHALDQYRGESLDEDVAGVILSTLQPIISELDECSLNQLKSNKHLFPDHSMLRQLHQDELSLHKYKQCLSLISDPGHLLQQYCRRLLHQLERRDETQYKEIFMKMKRQVFENPYSGPGYRVLLKYLPRLNEIDDFATDKQTIKQVLIDIQSELVSKRDTLSLSDVCPTLSQDKENGSLNKLLGLKRGLRVVKFEEKLSVYTAAVSRPVLVSFLASDGLTRRCIVKREGGGHAAVVRGRRAVGGVGGARGGYSVNTISDECLLIEYLEHHTPLRDLVNSVCPLDASVRESALDPVLSPGDARLHYAARCHALPRGALRAAVEARCATFQDFLYKKKNFQESVCWMTILNFLFGLSDRHLENILYGEAHGGACDVDCGDLSAGEIPPARLTRNILAVCDVTALEGSLQRKLSRIRDHQGIIIPSIKLSFKNTEKKYRDKVPFIQGKMQGSLLPHQVFRETIVDSPLQHHDKYILLLDQIFGTETKTEYSVEEQVRTNCRSDTAYIEHVRRRVKYISIISSLLLQCTDPRILSVTRPGWEPWI